MIRAKRIGKKNQICTEKKEQIDKRRKGKKEELNP